MAAILDAWKCNQLVMISKFWSYAVYCYCINFISKLIPIPWLFLDKRTEIKQSNSIKFKPFKPLENYSSVLDQIEDLISRSDYKSAMKHSINLRNLSLAGLHYFQTYDWLVLMTTVTLGYIGWMIFIILHILQSYSSLVETIYEKKNHVAHLRKTNKKVRNS